jgi:hypothetical protein
MGPTLSPAARRRGTLSEMCESNTEDGGGMIYERVGIYP